MNGHRRDDLANDINRGHPTFSPDADALAAEVSRLSTFDERQEFSLELNRRAAASPSSGEWWGQEDRYLAEFDPTGVDEITTFLTIRRDALLTRARERGWDVPPE